MSDGSTLTTTTERGPMNAFVSRAKTAVHKHHKGVTYGVTAVVVLIAAGLLVYFLVIKKPYRGGKTSKGSTRLVFEAQTQKTPTASSAASSKTTTPAVDP